MQDSQKRKLPVTKDNFFLVTLGRTRKEIAQSWFQDLAGNKPLSLLAKKVQFQFQYVSLYVDIYWYMCLYE